MENEKLTIPSKISGAQFREFAVFDTMRRQKRWLRPVVFAVFFIVIAALAFSRVGKTQGAALLGGVLLAVGIGLPAIYFGNFFLSVRKRARKIDPNEIAYTLTLSASGVDVKKDKQTASYEWSQLHGACRLAHGTCLYVDARHALLLPDNRNGAAWRMFAERLGEKAKEYHRNVE